MSRIHEIMCKALDEGRLFRGPDGYARKKAQS